MPGWLVASGFQQGVAIAKHAAATPAVLPLQRLLLNRLFGDNADRSVRLNVAIAFVDRVSDRDNIACRAVSQAGSEKPSTLRLLFPEHDLGFVYGDSQQCSITVDRSGKLRQRLVVGGRLPHVDLDLFPFKASMALKATPTPTTTHDRINSAQSTGVVAPTVHFFLEYPINEALSAIWQAAACAAAELSTHEVDLAARVSTTFIFADQTSIAAAARSLGCTFSDPQSVAMAVDRHGAWMHAMAANDDSIKMILCRPDGHVARILRLDATVDVGSVPTMIRGAVVQTLRQ